MSRMTREMFCLMEGRHVHPSTLYPGGVGTVPTVQLFTDYLVRLMKYVEFMKKVVPLHDDLFDFFYEALPGYEEVGRRRILLGCWGSFKNPDVCDYTYKNMTKWGRAMYVTPGRRRRRQARHHRPGRDQPRHPHPAGQLVLRRLGQVARRSSSNDPLGNPVDQRHPWNQTTIPKPQKRDFKGKYTWVMSPRWYDKRTKEHLALDTGGGPIARLWATALAGLVDIGYIKATGQSVKIYLPKTASLPEVEFEWKIPKWSNAIERDRARTYFQAYAAAAALHFVEQALKELHAGRTKTWTEFKVPDEAIGCGFHEAVRGVLSHHVVIRERQDRQLPSLSADPLERQPARHLRHARPLRRRRAEHADLRGERPRQVQGDRHHARRAQLRSLPALRRPHVPGQRQDARSPASPHVRRIQRPRRDASPRPSEPRFPSGVGRADGRCTQSRIQRG